MVYVNGKKFTVYDFDTLDSITTRIAAQLNTLPEYLYFPSSPTRKDFSKEKMDIIVIDNLKVLKDSVKDEYLSFKVIFDKIKESLSPTLNLKDDILYVWLAYNDTVKDNPSFRLVVEAEIEKELKGDFPNPEISRFYRQKYSDYLKVLEEKIKKNKYQVKEQLKMFQTFEEAKSAPSTKFELEKTSHELKLNLDFTLYELFDIIELNAQVPFSCVKKFYKILKDFIPPEDWAFSIDEAIIVKVLNVVNVLKNVMNEQYNQLFIYREKNNIKVTLDWNLNSKLNVSKTIKRFFTIFPKDEIKVLSEKQTQIGGVFYYPDSTLDNYVFADLVMNNPIFSIYLNINESLKATKRKSGVYIHFSDPLHPEFGLVSANITEKIVQRGDSITKNKDFPIGSEYLRIKVSRALNEKSVDNFKKIFSTLLGVYSKEYNSIVNFYRKFIPDFAKRVKKPVKKTKKILKDIVPDLFIKNYTRKCLHKPTIIGEEEIPEWEEKKFQIMQFPKTPEEGPQHYYVCNHKNFKYPGIRDNPLENSDKYPYLPCCYTTDHKNKKGSVYREYYFGEEKEEKVGKQQRLFTTNKILRYNKVGVLPTNLKTLFESLDSEHEYYRKGMIRNKNSFIQCVKEAVSDEFLSLNNKEKLKDLNKARKELAKSANLGVCKQEMYQESTEDIKSKLEDSDIYIDPKSFIHLLEVTFRVKIILFTRTLLAPKGKMILPYHLQSYLRNKNNLPMVFIYEHMGTEADEAKYPQCELIAKSDKKHKSHYQHSLTDRIYSGIERVYETINESYTLSKRIVSHELSPELKILAQGIDSFGKTRFLRVLNRDNTIDCLITPIQPLNVPELEEKEFLTETDLESAEYLFSDMDGVLISQNVTKSKINSICGRIGNVHFTIAVTPTEPNSVLSSHEQVIIPRDEISAMDTYNFNKKIARYLIEYMFYLFSHYLRKVDYEGNKTITTFINENVVEIENFEYGDVSKTFSMDSGVMKDEKLVVTSEDMLKRLIYVLRLGIVRNMSKIRLYSEKRVIENYYVDITDFHEYNGQVILQGPNSVQKWIDEKENKYVLQNRLQPLLIHPYFLRINKRIFLAQNVETLNEAQEIGVTWKKDEYNPREAKAKIKHNLAFKLYSYRSPNNIKRYNVSGKKNDYNLQIVGYKVGEDDDLVSQFTTLMKV